MKVLCEVSLGELVDKITILKIKTERIDDTAKVESAQKELKVLQDCLHGLGVDVSELESQLKTVNEELWVIEDDIRDKERSKEFDEEFVSLARKVYITNDKRFEIKNNINGKFGSNLQEVKSYKKYE